MSISSVSGKAIENRDRSAFVSASTQDASAGTSGKGRRGKLKAKAHKYSRVLHAYLSAAAFMALMFFAATGLLLNHPEWFASNDEVVPLLGEAQLSVDALDIALLSGDPDAAIARLAKERLPLLGALQSAEIFPGEEAYLRFGGVKGRSDATIDLATGLASYEIEKASMVEIVHNLHRGKDSGLAWKSLIDVSAILILVLSLFGFFLMIFIRFRFANSMIVLSVSSVAIAAVYVIFVP